MERVKIIEKISYITSSIEPLSAEVGIIEGKDYIYLFDVGNNKVVSEHLQTLSKKKKIILHEEFKMIHCIRQQLKNWGGKPIFSQNT